MNFHDWKPYLLSPRLARSSGRRRTTFLVGGFGFMLFLLLARSFGVLTIWSGALMWDLMVLTTFGVIWFYVAPTKLAVRAIRRRRSRAVEA